MDDELSFISPITAIKRKKTKVPFLVKQSLGTDAILSMPRITKGNVAGENVRMSLPFSGKKEKIRP